MGNVEGIAASCASRGTSYASEHIEIYRFGMSKLFGVNPGSIRRPALMGDLWPRGAVFEPC